MNRWIKYILIAATVALSLGYLAFAGEKSIDASQRKICSDIRISIVDYDKKAFVTDREIAALLRNEGISPIGQPLHRIRTKTIEEALSKHPMVRRAECYKTPDGQINISIEQRTPVLRVVGTENYYVDDLRKPIPVSSNYAAYVPVATGRVTREMAIGPLFDFVLFLSNNEFWGNQIEQINIAEQQKIELVPRVGNHIILLGSLERYEQKLEKLRKFYLYGLNEIGWNTYATIDLQYKDQIVCTRK